MNVRLTDSIDVDTLALLGASALGRSRTLLFFSVRRPLQGGYNEECRECHTEKMFQKSDKVFIRRRLDIAVCL